jgi:hypothetical protein
MEGQYHAFWTLAPPDGSESVSFLLLLLYPWRKCSYYVFDRLGGLQILSGLIAKRKIPSLTGSQIVAVQNVKSHSVE